MRIIIILAVILSLFLVSCSVKETTNEPETNTAPQVNPVVAEPQKNTTITNTTPAQKIACSSDSDCGVRTVKNAYCFQGNPVGDLYSWQCENPGTETAKCTQIHKNGIIAECGDTYFCYKGECVKYANCNDTDNGMNFTVRGKVLTNDNAVKEDYCKDDSTLVEYYCSSDGRAFSEEKACACEKDACKEE